MKTKLYHPDALSNRRFLISLSVFVAGTILAAFASTGSSNTASRSPKSKSAAGVRRSPTAMRGLPASGQNFWTQTNGPQGGDGIALARNSIGHVFVGTQGGGVFRSTDNAETWTGINNGLTATNVRALAISPVDHIFAGTFGGVFRSTDNGDHWIAVNNGLEFPFVISLAVNADGDIFAGTFEGGGVYRSTDDGENWTLVDNGLTNTYVTALAINSAGHIFAATFGGGAFRSTDNGDSWAQLNTGVPNATFLSLAINASGHIFAGGDPVGGPVGVLRSTDNGGTWQPVNNGLTTGNGINALIATVNGYLFAGSYGDGVFRSSDNGDNWIQVNNGLTAPFVLSFATNASGDIFAGTYFGNGVFRSTDNGRHLDREKQWVNSDGRPGNSKYAINPSTMHVSHFCRHVRDWDVSIK